MSYNDFYTDYNNDALGSVIFLHGAENFLMRWAVDLIISKNVSEENREFDVKVLSDDSLTIDDIMSSAMTYSMFSEKRVIVVRNFRPLYRSGASENDKTMKARIKSLCDTHSDTAVIVFSLDSVHESELSAAGKALAGAASDYVFSRLDRKGLESFICKRIKNAGKYISRRDLDYLIDLTGYFLKGSEYTLDDLENDIKKLVNATSETELGKELIEDVMTGEDERFVFDFIDALMAGKKSRAMELTLNNIRKDDASSMRIISLLTGQFEMMYDAVEMSRAGSTVSQMARAVGANEYRFRKACRAAERFSKERLSEILITLYDFDRKIKNGTVDKDTALELFVAGF